MEAFIVFSEGIHSEPENSHTWEWRGKSFMGLGDKFAEALMDFSYAIELEKKKNNTNESSQQRKRMSDLYCLLG
jgi:hypothetical protein